MKTELITEQELSMYLMNGPNLQEDLVRKTPRFRSGDLIQYALVYDHQTSVPHGITFSQQRFFTLTPKRLIAAWYSGFPKMDEFSQRFIGENAITVTSDPTVASRLFNDIYELPVDSKGSDLRNIVRRILGR